MILNKLALVSCWLYLRRRVIAANRLAVGMTALLLLAAPSARAATADHFALKNRDIRWSGAIHNARIEPENITNLRAGGRLRLSGPAFAIKLTSGHLLTSSQFHLAEPEKTVILPAKPHALRLANRLAGRRLEFHLVNRKTGLDATWAVTLRQGTDYLQESLTLAATTGAIGIRRITLFDGKLPDSRTLGLVPGSPVVAGNFFLGLENPMAGNRVTAKGRVVCSLLRNAPLKKSGTLTVSLVVGTFQPGQMRRDFLSYLEDARARPYKPFLMYVSWYDVSWGPAYAQAPCIASISAIGRQLVQRRHVRLNSFLFDDGWDNRNSIWRFNKGFPHGFAPLAAAAARFHAHIGVWLSPFGGYGAARARRVAWAKAHGFETDSAGLSLSGKKYARRFQQVCLNMMRHNGVNAFKFDGLAAGAGAAAAGQTLDGDAMLRIIHRLRQVQPAVYINQTTGTWASPFWLLSVDSTWRGGYDHNYLGDGSWCQKWITYRDATTYANVVQRGPLYPLNSLMLHGIILARHAGRLSAMNNRDFSDQVWSYFGSGTQLQELYISPGLMNTRKWNILAAAARWSRRNARTLVDTHWIGGNPAKGQVYGWAAWSRKMAILVVRNPTASAKGFSVHLNRVFQLPAGAPHAYLFSSPQIPAGQQRLIRITAGQPRLLKLAPFEVRVFDGVPAGNH